MIGKRLRALREEKGQKQADIANILGVSRTTYTQYETGKSEPDLETVKKLAEYFNTTTDYLLGKPGAPAIDLDSQVVKESLTGFMADDGNLSLEGLIRIIKETVREALDEREKDNND